MRRLTWPVPGRVVDLSVPAHLLGFAGGTADRNVPVAHARVIADRCPPARLHIVKGGGHMLLSHLDQIIESLAPHAA